MSILAGLSSSGVATAPGSGYLSTSADGGASWMPLAISLGPRNWWSVAPGNNSNLLLSADGGATWRALPGAGAGSWYAAASSSTGTRLAATRKNVLLTSADGGQSWTPRLSKPDGAVFAVGALAASADGARLLAPVWGGSVYTSANYGKTWTMH